MKKLLLTSLLILSALLFISCIEPSTGGENGDGNIDGRFLLTEVKQEYKGYSSAFTLPDENALLVIEIGNDSITQWMPMPPQQATQQSPRIIPQITKFFDIPKLKGTQSRFASELSEITEFIKTLELRNIKQLFSESEFGDLKHTISGNTLSFSEEIAGTQMTLVFTRSTKAIDDFDWVHDVISTYQIPVEFHGKWFLKNMNVKVWEDGILDEYDSYEMNSVNAAASEFTASISAESIDLSSAFEGFTPENHSFPSQGPAAYLLSIIANVNGTKATGSIIIPITLDLEGKIETLEIPYVEYYSVSFEKYN